MRTGQLPINEQVAQFRAAQSRNPTLTGVLTRAATMSLPGWYLVAGCLYQTVWNVVTAQPPEAGILDYDLAYFDASDLSWEAEDAVIQAGREVFAGVGVPVQIRNQARVQMWYEQRFGVPCPPHDSAEAAIDTFEATTACLGVRLLSGGRWRVYAPHGFGDVFNLVARPNRCGYSCIPIRLAAAPLDYLQDGVDTEETCASSPTAARQSHLGAGLAAWLAMDVVK